MSKPDQASKKLYRIRDRWWEQLMGLLREIAGLERVSQVKKGELLDRLYEMTNTLNAAWFRNPGILDVRPPARRRRQPAKPKRNPKPAPKRSLRLVPPPTVH